MEYDFTFADIHTIGVVGLGLIGGSYAKAYRENTECRILGKDTNPDAVRTAIEDGTLDGELTEDMIPECDLLLVALYPEAIIEYVTSVADRIRPEAFVIDTGGLKRNVCRALFPLAAEKGFTFIGGHPMAGKKTSGYHHSSGTLFKGASMILVPDDVTDFDTLANVVFSAQSSDICLNMVDGRVIYRDGECVFMDRERVIYEAEASFGRILGEL